MKKLSWIIPPLLIGLVFFTIGERYRHFQKTHPPINRPKIQQVNQLSYWTSLQEFRVKVEPVDEEGFLFRGYMEKSDTYAQRFDFSRLIEVHLLIDDKDISCKYIFLPPNEILSLELCEFLIDNIDGNPIQEKHQARLRVVTRVINMNESYSGTTYVTRKIDFP